MFLENANNSALWDNAELLISAMSSLMPNKSAGENPAKSTPEVAPAEKKGLHARNRHRGRYDFRQLVAASPELAAFVSLNAYNDESIDFANPAAVRALNHALLQQAYGITGWDIPPRYLCPPIPGRADHLHYLADLLGSCNGGVVPQGEFIRVLDVGVGANCIYPLIGHSEYGWQFVGSDIDRAALASAKAILEANRWLRDAVELRRQTSAANVFKGVLRTDELFDLIVCNPPFHASLEEAKIGAERKWQNLGKGAPRSKAPVLNFGGQAAELCCDGGEEGFISRMIAESGQFQTQCLWFTTLVSKASSLPTIYRALKKVGVHDSRTIEMAHGQKKSRIVAWTFLNKRQQQGWQTRRWGRIGRL
jgi:23S rRNA (adenine1618-N6)-methyltransferase